MTTAQKRIVKQMIGLRCVSLIFGVPITSIYRGETKLTRHLARYGRHAQGVVSEKRTTSTGQGRDSCYIAFEFHVPLNASDRSPVRLIRNEVIVSDKVYDTTEKGQAVVVLYDPRDPDISMLEVSGRYPLFPSWLIANWWIGSALALIWLLGAFWLEHRLAHQEIPLSDQSSPFSS